MALYALTIFVSAFLIFQVQPILARYLLPWYGGTPAVWTTCLMFFQVLLLGGYAYAHVIRSRLPLRRQAAVHGAFLLLSAAFLPITPGKGSMAAGLESPTLGILALLGASVALPYVMLSTSSSLLQYWFSRTHWPATPYRLFALSNFGSLLGLLTYPFLVEPWLSVRAQTQVWSVGYGVYLVACGACAVRVFRHSVERPVGSALPHTAPSAADMKALWLLLPATASVVLLATTNQMSQNVAVVPFLWVVPLSLYLLSFVVAFDHERWYARRVWLPVLLMTLFAVLYGHRVELGFLQQTVLYSTTVFACCMVCHGELVRLRPPAHELTTFYLMVASGGALGGIFVSLIAPVVFQGYWEFQVGLVGTCVLAGICLNRGQAGGSRGSLRADVVWAAGIGVLVFAFARGIQQERAEPIAVARDFYGVLRIYDEQVGTATLAARSLYHGGILHGTQFVDAHLRREPTTYYGRSSGVGRAIDAYRQLREAESSPGNGLRIGVVGLGTGTIATFGRAGETFRFYEISPEVVRLALRWFTFLDDSAATVEIVLGDGRMSLERELREGSNEPFDLLVVDAFAGGAVPVHLLTREAFDLYRAHLRPDGLLAVHVSNRHLDLGAVVRGLAEAAGQTTILTQNPAEEDSAIAEADWALVTTNRRVLHGDVLASQVPWPDTPPVLWSDDFSNLLRVLK